MLARFHCKVVQSVSSAMLNVIDVIEQFGLALFQPMFFVFFLCCRLKFSAQLV